MPTMVYQYGARRPLNADLVMPQIREGAIYYNKIIEAERKRRAAYDELVKTDEVRSIENEIELVEVGTAVLKKKAADLRQEAGVEKKCAADMTLAQPSLKASTRIHLAARLEAIKAEQADVKAAQAAAEQKRAKLYVDLSDARKSHRNAALEESKATLMQAFFDECKAIYHAHPNLFWGTKNALRAAADKSIEASRKFKAGQPPPAPPKFRRWEGEGSITAQAIKGASATVFWMEPAAPAPGADPNSKRSQKAPRMLAKLRIGSNEDRSGIYAEIPIIMHRPLPPGAEIRQATLHRRMIANHERWLLDVTLFVAEPEATGARGVTGVDLGWRKVDGGIRVGMVYNGKDFNELVIPSRLIEKAEHADSLRSIRDMHTNTIKTTLAAYFGSLTDLPAWAKAAGVESLAHWRREGRFSHLCRVWERHEGDGKVWTALEAWRRQSLHLWQWECHERQAVVNARKDMIRKWAHSLVGPDSGCGTLVCEDMDLRPMIERNEDGQLPNHALEKASRARHVAAPGELRLILSQSAKRHGVTFVKAKTADTTRTCADCGHVNTFARPALLVQTCASCDLEWDQDMNAAIVIRRRGIEDLSSTPTLTNTEPQLGRFAKKRAEKAEKAKASASA